MNIIQLITAFGGGMLGAAIGGVPAFVFTGLTVIIAIFAGESGMPVIGTLSFGSVFGPHVAFGGAVAAAALAKKKGLVENGQDLSVPLFSTGDSRDVYKRQKECYKEKWDVRTLRRQMDSALFLRLATSRDKEGILALAREGITYEKPEDGYEVTYDHHQSSISGL